MEVPAEPSYHRGHKQVGRSPRWAPLLAKAHEMINRLDPDGLRGKFRAAQPYPHMVIDNFLLPGAAERVSKAYPSFDEAKRQGFSFNMVNEQKKVQITDPIRFPEAVRELNEAISSPAFLADLSYITGIPNLLADPRLTGGGMHLTGSGGRLDVHVDFNILEQQNPKLFRRLNILIYLNSVWDDGWGGQIELWDREVKQCHARCLPALNRCLIFETSESSFHGVAPITAPPSVVRQSYAAYYYTAEAPSGWDGKAHTTVFRARPNEKFRGLISMPMEKLRGRVVDKLRRSKRAVKALVGL
jgi:hypothetical protein